MILDEHIPDICKNYLSSEHPTALNPSKCLKRDVHIVGIELFERKMFLLFHCRNIEQYFGASTVGELVFPKTIKRITKYVSS